MDDVGSRGMDSLCVALMAGVDMAVKFRRNESKGKRKAVEPEAAKEDGDVGREQEDEAVVVL